MQTLPEETLAAAVRRSTEEVFATMLGLPLACGEAGLEVSASESVDGVVALVGIVGTWAGSGRISCSAPFACRLSTAMLGTEYTAVNDDVLDAIAEVTNMIIGNVKSALEDELGPMGLSIPTVIYGRNYCTRSNAGNPPLLVPFFSDADRMDVRLYLAPNTAPSYGRADSVSHVVS